MGAVPPGWHRACEPAPRDGTHGLQGGVWEGHWKGIFLTLVSGGISFFASADLVPRGVLNPLVTYRQAPGRHGSPALFCLNCYLYDGEAVDLDRAPRVSCLPSPSCAWVPTWACRASRWARRAREVIGTMGPSPGLGRVCCHRGRAPSLLIHLRCTPDDK